MHIKLLYEYHRYVRPFLCLLDISTVMGYN